MVEELFRQDAYLKEAGAAVTAVEDRGVRLDRSIFYPTGGGQPGDTGMLRWDGGEAKVVDTLKAEGGDVLLVLAAEAARPAVGASVQTVLDWQRRHLHMRMHTALHVMSAVIKGNVTGGQVGVEVQDFQQGDGQNVESRQRRFGDCRIAWAGTIMRRDIERRVGIVGQQAAAKRQSEGSGPDGGGGAAHAPETTVTNTATAATPRPTAPPRMDAR